MIKPVPIKIIAAPKKSYVLPKVDVPIIKIPLITPITTETLSFCINFIVKTVVIRTVKPQPIINNHCQILGTMIWKAGNNIGIVIAASNKN